MSMYYAAMMKTGKKGRTFCDFFEQKYTKIQKNDNLCQEKQSDMNTKGKHEKPRAKYSY